MSLIKRSVRWVAIDTLVSRGASLVAFVLIARVLGPETMGVVAVLLLLREVSNMVSDFGFSQAIIHHPSPTSRQLATLYTLNWGLGLFAFSGVVSLAPYIADFFGQPQIQELLPVAALGFLLEPIGQQVNARLQKDMNFSVLAKVSTLGAGVNAVVSVSGVYLGFGVWAVVIASLLSSVVRQGAYLSLAMKRSLLHGFALDFRGSRPLISFGVYRTGATILNMMNSRADQFVIGGLMGSTALGVYTMAANWTVMVMQTINGIATKVAFPAMSRFQDDSSRLRLAYFRLVNRAGTANTAIFFGLAGVSEPLVYVVLGTDWAALVPVLQLMCIYALLRSLGNLNGPLAMALGRASWAFYWNLGLAAIIPGTLWLAGQLGRLEIVVLALVALQLLLATLMYIYWTRRLIGPCLAPYLSAVTKPWLCGSIMLFTVSTIIEVLNGKGEMLQLLVAIPIGAFIYLGTSWLINREGLKDIIALIQRDANASQVRQP